MLESLHANSLLSKYRYEIITSALVVYYTYWFQTYVLHLCTISSTYIIFVKDTVEDMDSIRTDAGSISPSPSRQQVPYTDRIKTIQMQPILLLKDQGNQSVGHHETNLCMYVCTYVHRRKNSTNDME